MKPILVVLAAGIGSRYGGLKQIDPVGPGGEIVLDYSVYDALRAGFGKVVFVIRSDIEKAFRETIGERIESRVETVYVHQETNRLPEGLTACARTKPWGTAHAILVAEKEANGPFAAINADDFYGRHSFSLLADYLSARPGPSSSTEYALVGFELRKTLSAHGHVARGVCDVTANGYLAGVREHTRIECRNGDIVSIDPQGEEMNMNGDSIVSMNCWGFTPTLFAELHAQFRRFVQQRGTDPKSEFFIPSVIDGMIRTGMTKVRVLRTDSSWFGVTYREDKRFVIENIQALVKQSEYPERLWTS